MRYNQPDYDPHYRQTAKVAARGAFAAAEETRKIEERAKKYVPGYGNPSARNTGSPAILGSAAPKPPAAPAAAPQPEQTNVATPAPAVGGLTPAADWRAQFTPTLGGAAQKAAMPPPAAPAAPAPAPAPAMPATAPAVPLHEQIRLKYDPRATPSPTSPASITPPTSVVPQGNPAALKPGEGWTSPTIDPRAGSTVRAPDGIIERVSPVAGKGGGNISSMFRPNEYTGPGESPTGIVHNNIPKAAPTPQPPPSRPAPPPMDLQNKAMAMIPTLRNRGSAANNAYVETFHRTGSHEAALQAAQATQPTLASALPAEYSPY